jgi:predicted RNA binding protein YcfA (HicA-like mRNA interferase family)
MPHKIPRDLSGQELVKLLKRYGYMPFRQKGSHMRLISYYRQTEHKITIPDHNYIKIKTLNNILSDISDYLQLSKEELVKALFE